jgi:hypothetical protein
VSPETRRWLVPVLWLTAVVWVVLVAVNGLVWWSAKSSCERRAGRLELAHGGEPVGWVCVEARR